MKEKIPLGRLAIGLILLERLLNLKRKLKIKSFLPIEQFLPVELKGHEQL